jgi:hypothetical protein
MKPPKPRRFRVTERRDAHPVIRTADDRRDRNQRPTDQLVAALARVARVIKVGKNGPPENPPGARPSIHPLNKTTEVSYFLFRVSV